MKIWTLCWRLFKKYGFNIPCDLEDSSEYSLEKIANELKMLRIHFMPEPENQFNLRQVNYSAIRDILEPHLTLAKQYAKEHPEIDEDMNL